MRRDPLGSVKIPGNLVPGMCQIIGNGPGHDQIRIDPPAPKREGLQRLSVDPLCVVEVEHHAAFGRGERDE